MRTAKMFWRDMCLGTFRHGARFLIIPLVVVLMSAGFAEYAANLYDQRLCAWSKTKCGFFSRSAGTFVWRFYELCQSVRYYFDFRCAAICHIYADDRDADAIQFLIYTGYKLCRNVWCLYSICLLYLLVVAGKLYDVAEKFLYQF